MPTKNCIKKLSASFTQHPLYWIALLLLTLIPAIYFCSNLKLESDFKRLLPKDKPSVRELDRVLEKVGGIGTLNIVVESSNQDAIEKFITDLVPKIKELPKPYVRFVNYNTQDVRSYYEKNRQLFIDLEDLKTIHDRLKKKIEYEKNKHNPFFFALDDQKTDFDISDIEAKYKSKTSDYDKYKDGFYFSEDQGVAVVLIQPYGSATGPHFSKELIGKIDQIVQKVDPKKYDPSMKISYRGKYNTILQEYQQLNKDVLGTLAICLILVVSVIFIYFLRFRAIFLLAMPLVLASAWTFALTSITIGYLNSQTVFLGSIIVGNGVNSGIVLLARYFEERRKNLNLEEAIYRSIDATYASTLAAALTTCFSFLALHFSQLKGLSQFGFIGTTGMFLAWIATYFSIPPVLVLTERVFSTMKVSRRQSKQWEPMFLYLARLITVHSKKIVYFSIAGVLLSLAAFVHFVPHSMEYDFSKLQNKTIKTTEQKNLDERIDSIFPKGNNPKVILLNDESEASSICEKIMHREDAIPADQRTIDSCKTMYDYLPARQDEKLAELDGIKKTLADQSLNFVKGKYKIDLDKFRDSVITKKIEIQDLPVTIQNQFRELDGRLGRIVYIYARKDANLSNGKRLIQFSDALTNIKLDDGKSVSLSGDSAIFADINRAIKVDGPKTSILAFIFVSLIVIVMFRRPLAIGYVMGGLIVGVVLMLGIQAAFDIKLNFFNFIALPITFGIGVDYGVNLFQRYRLEGRGSIQTVVHKMGGAIFLCSLTTIIGYVSLVFATNQSLVSFGWLAFIGEVTCVVTTLVIMPAIIYLIDLRHNKSRNN